MVSRDGEADLPVDFEPARRREEPEGRRTQRVSRGEDDAAVVDARGEGGVWRTAQGEVPFEQVGLQGDRVEVEGRGGGEFLGFSD